MSAIDLHLLEDDGLDGLREHVDVFDAWPVEANPAEQRIVRIQFRTPHLPQWVSSAESLGLREVWVGTVPPIYLRWASEWAIRRGIGRSAIAGEFNIVNQSLNSEDGGGE